MKLVIAATSKVAIPTIESLLTEHEVILVSQPDKPAGRGKSLKSSEIAEHFKNVVKPNTELELQTLLKGADLLITISYGRLLSPDTLALPKHGGINLHFSLLPRWRGAAPVQRAIEAGDRISGVTVFQMDKGMDTGPIWTQCEFPIPYGFTSDNLFSELALLGVDAIKESIKLIGEGALPTQQVGQATIAKKVTKEECIINWNEPADLIIRKIRAFGANPGVTTRIRGEVLKILEARQTEVVLPIAQLNSSGQVGTADYALDLITVTPSGRKTMSVSDWLNGFKPTPGEKFE